VDSPRRREGLKGARRRFFCAPLSLRALAVASLAQERNSMKLMLVAGTRPDFIKIAPLMDAFHQTASVKPILVYTGQHRDWRMCGLFSRQLGIPDPDENLDIDGSTLSAKLATVVLRFETLLMKHRPDYVLVVGNVKHAIGCVLLAAEMNIRVIHVEAGLRNLECGKYEDVERVITDHLSDLLFCTEKRGVDNLLREGIPQSRIHLVGNVAIDTLRQNRRKANASIILSALELVRQRYSVVTVHHKRNVEDPEAFSRIISAMKIVGRDMPVVFPMHPQSRKRLSLAELNGKCSEIRFVDPLGYHDFIKLIENAKVVFTDSGGVQEETTVLNVPCLTLRNGTDRQCTAEIGTNYVVGTDPDKIVNAYRHCLHGGHKQAKIPSLWDGCASERIAKIIAAEGDSETASTKINFG
jgi:UDP-N-acetylglucosamine 2-epimerase (non-hydrolysing)